MRIPLIYPQYPDTFWSFKHSLNFIAKKAAFPPLGLLTAAAMLPGGSVSSPEPVSARGNCW